MFNLTKIGVILFSLILGVLAMNPLTTFASDVSEEDAIECYHPTNRQGEYTECNDFGCYYPDGEWCNTTNSCFNATGNPSTVDLEAKYETDWNVCLESIEDEFAGPDEEEPEESGETTEDNSGDTAEETPADDSADDSEDEDEAEEETSLEEELSEIEAILAILVDLKTSITSTDPLIIEKIKSLEHIRLNAVQKLSAMIEAVNSEMAEENVREKMATANSIIDRMLAILGEYCNQNSESCNLSEELSDLLNSKMNPEITDQFNRIFNTSVSEKLNKLMETKVSGTLEKLFEHLQSLGDAKIKIIVESSTETYEALSNLEGLDLSEEEQKIIDLWAKTVVSKALKAQIKEEFKALLTAKKAAQATANYLTKLNQLFTENEEALVTEKVQYKDVKLADNQWYYSYVMDGTQKGHFSGDQGKGTFRPGDNMNRAEALKTFLEASGIGGKAGASTTLWYQPYVEQAKSMGLSIGNSTDWSTPISREELATLIYEVGDFEPASYNSDFPDVKASDSIASVAATMKKFQIIKGQGNGNFAAKANANRAEVATMVSRYLEATDAKEFSEEIAE